MQNYAIIYNIIPTPIMDAGRLTRVSWTLSLPEIH